MAGFTQLLLEMPDRQAGAIHAGAAMDDDGLRKLLVGRPDLFEVGVPKGWGLVIAGGDVCGLEPRPPVVR